MDRRRRQARLARQDAQTSHQCVCTAMMITSRLPRSRTAARHQHACQLTKARPQLTARLHSEAPTGKYTELQPTLLPWPLSLLPLPLAAGDARRPACPALRGQGPRLRGKLPWPVRIVVWRVRRGSILGSLLLSRSRALALKHPSAFGRRRCPRPHQLAALIKALVGVATSFTPSLAFVCPHSPYCLTTHSQLPTTALITRHHDRPPHLPRTRLYRARRRDPVVPDGRALRLPRRGHVAHRQRHLVHRQRCAGLRVSCCLPLVHPSTLGLSSAFAQPAGGHRTPTVARHRRSAALPNFGD